jgi:hypothetical protein
MPLTAEAQEASFLNADLPEPKLSCGGLSQLITQLILDEHPAGE